MNLALLKQRNRIKMKRNIKNINANNKNSNYINKLFTRTLISVILVLLCAIFINISDKNLIIFRDYFFNETLSFTKINELYTKYFGNIVPSELTSSIPVFENSKTYKQIEKQNDSYLVNLNSNTFAFLESGIVVFIGEKENLGLTLIVQGNDGVDIWYSNLKNTSVSIYDYIKKDQIIGEVNDNNLLLTFIENGEYIGYEKYLN